jgi:hypothetical protein
MACRLYKHPLSTLDSVQECLNDLVFIHRTRVKVLTDFTDEIVAGWMRGGKCEIMTFGVEFKVCGGVEIRPTETLQQENDKISMSTLKGSMKWRDV